MQIQGGGLSLYDFNRVRGVYSISIERLLIDSAVMQASCSIAFIQERLCYRS